jgi:CRP-like cAMP-binding protein
MIDLVMQSIGTKSFATGQPRSSLFSLKPSSTSQDARYTLAAAAQDAFTKAICSRLEYLNANDVALMLSKAKPMSFAPGDTLIKEGTRSPGFFMLRTGEAEVRRGGATLAKFVAGDVCGEMSFLEDSVASATVVASTAVTAEFLSVQELSDVFAAFPHLASRFYRSMALTLSRRLRATSQRLCAAQEQAKQR